MKNTWKISNARQLDKVAYWGMIPMIAEKRVEEIRYFLLQGPNIWKERNFMLNLHGIRGFFWRFAGIAICLWKISQLQRYGNQLTSWPRGFKKMWKHLIRMFFVAKRYFELIDNPIMYSKPVMEDFQVKWYFRFLECVILQMDIIKRRRFKR